MREVRAISVTAANHSLTRAVDTLSFCSSQAVIDCSYADTPT